MNSIYGLSMSVLATKSLLPLGIGTLIGCVHFRALRWNTRLFVANEALLRPLSLQAARLSVTVMALYGCARLGVFLPMVLLGLLLARHAAFNEARST